MRDIQQFEKVHGRFTKRLLGMKGLSYRERLVTTVELTKLGTPTPIH